MLESNGHGNDATPCNETAMSVSLTPSLSRKRARGSKSLREFHVKIYSLRELFRNLHEIGAMLKKILFLLLWLPPAMAGADCINVNLGVTGKIYCLEVANTDKLLRKGLQGRHSLPRNGGMLFVFPTDATRVMWMKDTLMTLDMLFLDDSGGIRSMDTRISPSDIKLYAQARYVIELAGGTAEKLQLAPGYKVSLPAIRLEP